MPILAFFFGGLVAFGLGFGLTRLLQRARRPQPAAAEVGPHPEVPATNPLPPTPDPADPALDRQVRDLLGQGRLIDAIKQVRDTTGWSLSAAKAYVEDRLP
ncbi:MAG TPA: hypothetical protein VLS96_21480 [Nodosilinea sp.]|nr:hypothetical protein [Nodosilinea sp.]